MTPEAVAHEIDLLNVLLLDHFLEGGNQANLAGRFHEFSKPGNDEFDRILRVPINADDFKAVAVLQGKLRQAMAGEDSDAP